MHVGLLVATAVWHLLAAWHFGVTPERTLARTTDARPVSPIAAEIFRFLAGMNVAVALLAALAIAAPASRAVAHVVLAVANATQWAGDVRVARLGLARGGMFRQILVGDAIFTVLNAVAAALA